MDYDDENPSRYWNLKEFGPYMDAKSCKTNTPAPKKRHFRRSAADTRLPHEIRSELISRGSHSSEWLPITRKEALYGLRSSKHVPLYRQTGKSWEPVKHLTSSMCSSEELIVLRRHNTSNERFLSGAGLMKDFSPAKTARGPVSWEQFHNDLNSAYPIKPAKQSPLKPPMMAEDRSPSADAATDDPLGVSGEGIDTGPAIDFIDYTKILGGIGAGLVESTIKGLYHAGAAVGRPSERLQDLDNIEYTDIENQEVPEKGLSSFSELASAMYEQAKLSSENYRKAVDSGEYFEAGKEVSHDPLMQMTGLGDLAVFGTLGRFGRITPKTSTSTKYSAEPFAYGRGTRLERSHNLVGEATKASGIDNIYDFVDVIRYEPGSSYFNIEGGTRVLNIGSNAFNKTRAGQLVEASHEIGHAQVFEKLSRKIGFEDAYKEAFLNSEKGFGQKLYAREEQLVERLARWRVRKHLGGLSPQQEAASTKYIQNWKIVEQSFN